ncbi:MAG: acetamidase/formamidase family protein [Chloroflexi bacterium]|nr:acetamidase/formamidase family protein [Chloroflexota bacterium]
MTFETSGRTFSRLVRGETLQEIGIHNANLVTGPVFVQGAEPGDTLTVEILEVTLKSAWSVWFPGLGPLGRHTNRLQIREVHLAGDHAIINDRLTVLIRPMVGVVGLAPATGIGSTFHPAYPWGGNMDLRELGPGRSVLSLPVQVQGNPQLPTCKVVAARQEVEFRRTGDMIDDHRQHGEAAKRQCADRARPQQHTPTAAELIVIRSGSITSRLVSALGRLAWRGAGNHTYC